MTTTISRTVLCKRDHRSLLGVVANITKRRVPCTTRSGGIPSSFSSESTKVQTKVLKRDKRNSGGRSKTPSSTNRKQVLSRYQMAGFLSAKRRRRAYKIQMLFPLRESHYVQYYDKVIVIMRDLPIPGCPARTTHGARFGGNPGVS
jgi:hypothetical protein